jgi:hypothetical protein
MASHRQLAANRRNGAEGDHALDFPTYVIDNFQKYLPGCGATLTNTGPNLHLLAAVGRPFLAVVPISSVYMRLSCPPERTILRARN